MTLNPVSVKVDNNNSLPRKQVAFRGGGNPIIWMMDGINKGGFAAQFVTQDMLGMALPRTAAGLTRNSKDTGEKNTAYARLVAIREFLSGPSSFMIPAAMLYATKKHFGAANDVPSTYIKAFSDDFTKFADANPEALKNPKELKAAYYKHSVRNLIENSTLGKNGKSLLSPEEINAETEKFTQKLIDMESAPKKYLWSPKTKDGKQIVYAKDLKGQFLEDFVELRKKHSENPSNKINTAWFKSESQILNTEGNGEKFVKTSVGRFVDHLRDYTKDLSNSISKKLKPGENVKNFVENFCHKRVGSRFISNLSMTAAVICFFTIIPKLYNSKDGKNPALAGLTPEQTPPAEKKEVK